ncbi:Serine/threonine-protein kinase PknD [Streptomyces sp. RB5]|uniref:non-specific serine/threonine protein kinase n=1 Tax=Streptomyces smaragdinus TaxID=2585196 RepID=A0A7K0CAC5_9ACTN|nr:serine/threonine-protein kinase [Streptomyces smaragdinus]MQY10407.1 Serine/threonine-protein kinase PknD [Streptomyces smaragdinus]
MGTGDGGGRVLAGRYRIVAQLGRGGMGTVWRAVDEVLGREVAVKELRSYSDADGTELAALGVRMQREARAAARVRHTGVVAVHDVVEHEGRPVIVMELVDGPSLADVLRREGPLDPVAAARIGAGVMDALAAAHAAGVLHRDVKPGNVLLERGGRVVLTDFGIAAMDDPGDDAGTRLTGSGEIVGSLDYLAPERARGDAPDAPADVWALGATLYAAVEGTAPFRRTSTWSTITAIVVEPLPEPKRAGALGPALHALMAKDPAARPDAAGAARMLTEIAEGGAGLPPSAADTTRLRAPAPPASPAVPVVADVPTVRTTPSPAAPHTRTELDAAAPLGTFGPPHPGPEPSPGRRLRPLLIAAGVVAVLLAGGGAAYLVGRDGDDPTGPVAASHTPSASTAGEQPAGGGAASEGTDDRPKGSESPSAEASKKAPAAAAGTSGDSGGGSDGGSGDTGGTSGSGGSGDGGDSGGTSSTGGTGSTNGGSTDGSSTSGSSTGGSSPKPSCTSIGGGKYNCTVWGTADSYDSAHRKVGVLYTGTNYFYCQVKTGWRETYGEWTNVWWAKTDDDSGNANVYISDVYIDIGENDSPVPGLPVC